ncbi:MAG: hypothetical protein M3Y33_20760 [Actinomycetota bacterium]|nr:hypothetical protein [Actinomycetota bacterium]
MIGHGDEPDAELRLLITLVYFITQMLAAPPSGLPSVPAALLTLLGVSTTACAANKIVDTRGRAVS